MKTRTRIALAVARTRWTLDDSPWLHSPIRHLRGIVRYHLDTAFRCEVDRAALDFNTWCAAHFAHWLDWTCPDCGWRNSDDPTQTARPLCEVCERDYDWSDLKTKPNWPESKS